MTYDPRAVDWMEVPLEELSTAMRDFQYQGLTSTDVRYTQWAIGAVQARLISEAARMQEKSSQELTNATNGLVSATKRLGWFTLALVIIAVLQVALVFWD